MQIDLSKALIEAKMTHDPEMFSDLGRRNDILELEQKKVWVALKDRFNLWDIDEPTSFFIRIKNGLLVLASTKSQSQAPGNLMLRMDDDTIKNFLLRLLGGLQEGGEE